MNDFTEFVVDDAIYKTTLNKMHRMRKPYEPENPMHLKSFMPGNIPEVFVKKGDAVKAGDCLLILEAMKMKNQILAPIDAKVKAIHVKVGDTVPKNFVLIELKE
ncbi:MAG: biotin/lipoyl-containing protein [Bacteroidota bacterium]